MWRFLSNAKKKVQIAPHYGVLTAVNHPWHPMQDHVWEMRAVGDKMSEHGIAVAHKPVGQMDNEGSYTNSDS